ncbi:uracil-DNA glycosylase [Novispirillum itersonii]|uniref:uracil-DNA glycosylase n=1 Tax=Novispirillum itersonii TaxID=189 RepID=UPI00036FA44E|nr:uracil-DNA glycosylase [Novispirillum itersonii]
MSAAVSFSGPGRDCALCPRLADFIAGHRAAQPDWHNAPVPSFGPLTAGLLVVGLAPGLRGANRTGRPFTGDYAGELLYPALLKFGLADGQFRADPQDGLRLLSARITNAVRCVPPENKPTPLEQKTCRPFLKDEIASMPRLRVILALGRIAHDAVLSTLGLRKADYAFAHGARHSLPGGLVLADTYHTSRYNVNTGRLTVEMFETVMAGLLPALQKNAG